MRRTSLFLVSAVVFGNAAIAACNGDNTATGDAGPDAVVVPKDSGKEAAPPQEAGPVLTPNGHQIISSDSIQIFGITSDNFVIFSDNGSGASLYAADAAGVNAPVLIASPTVSSTSTYIAGIAGKDVFLWEGVSTTANAPQVGKLSVWRSGGTLKQATLKSCASSGFGSSTSGDFIVYSTSDTTCSTGNIVGNKVDGTAETILATAVDIADSTCTPFMGFPGTGALAVVATCTATPPDGGTPAADVATFDTAAAWAKTAVASGQLNLWGTDTAGDKLLVASPTAIKEFPLPIAASTGTTIDTKNVQSGFLYMTKDGTSAIYGTSAGDLYTSPIAVPLPVQLLTSGVKVVRAISSDDKYVIYHTNVDAKMFGSDLYMHATSSLSALTASTTLVGTTTGALFGLNNTDNFTTDAKYALFINNVDNTADIGDLNYIAVGAATGTKVTTAEWLNLSAAGSKIVYNDNCQGCGVNSNNQVIGIADIKSVDVSTTNTPTLMQAGADPQIYVPQGTKDHVIFTFSQNTPGGGEDGGPIPNGNGLYTIAIP